MNIRLACAVDAASLAWVERSQPFSAHWGKDGFAQELQNRSAAVWCVENEGTVLGFLALRQAAGVCEILNLAVLPHFCRQGLATRLLASALAQLRALKAERVTLEVNEKNGAAISLYTQAGFKELGRRKKFYNAADDALIMGIFL